MSELAPETTLAPPEASVSTHPGMINYDSGNQIVVSPNINPVFNNNIGAQPESGSSGAENLPTGVAEPRRIEVSVPDIEPEPASVPPETAAEATTEADSLRSELREMRQQMETMQAQQAQLLEQLTAVVAQQAQILERLANNQTGSEAPETPNETQTTPDDAAAPEAPPEGAVFDWDEDGGLEPSETTPPATDPEAQEVQYNWNPNVGDQVAVVRGDGIIEQDWTIIKIEGEGDERIITAGKPPTNHEIARGPIAEFIDWQVQAGLVNDVESDPAVPGEPGAQDVEEETVVEDVDAADTTENPAESEPLSTRRQRAWQRMVEIVSWPYNRAYNYVMFETNEKQKKKRIAGMVLGGIAVGAVLGYAIDVIEDYFEGKHGVPKTGVGGAILEHHPGNGGGMDGGRGEHMAFFGHNRVAGAELPSSLHFGVDSDGHRIVLDNHNAVVLAHADLPHGIEKSSGDLSEAAVAKLRFLGHPVSYHRIDGVTPNSSPLYMSEVR